MSYFDKYSQFLGIPYDDGDADCYGLCRRYYAANYGIELPDYARSADFFAADIDLITPFLLEEGFVVVDAPLDRLETGDGLLLCVRSRSWPAGKINHVAVYVGNQMILHHMYEKPSCEDAFTTSWKSRVMAVIRHPEISAKNAELASAASVDLISLLPDHVKQKYGLIAAPVLDSNSGEGGPSPI